MWLVPAQFEVRHPRLQGIRHRRREARVMAMDKADRPWAADPEIDRRERVQADQDRLPALRLAPPHYRGDGIVKRLIICGDAEAALRVVQICIGGDLDRLRLRTDQVGRVQCPVAVDYEAGNG